MLTKEDYMNYKMNPKHTMNNHLGTMIKLSRELLPHGIRLSEDEKIKGLIDSLPDQYGDDLKIIIMKMHTRKLNFMKVVCKVELAEERCIMRGTWRSVALSLHPNLRSARQMGTKLWKGPSFGRVALKVTSDCCDVTNTVGYRHGPTMRDRLPYFKNYEAIHVEAWSRKIDDMRAKGLIG